MKMESKVQNLDKEVIELDKEMAILSVEYASINKALEETNTRLNEISELLNKLCTRQEKDRVVIKNLERELQKYQQYSYGIIVGVVVFVVTQIVLMLH